MATKASDRIIGRLRRIVLLEGAAGPSDAVLLGRFIDKKDELAFEMLMRRHGSMVLGVCRRLLPNAHDAEDAFQATFLVLVRKAPSVRPRSMVGNWLYGVARQTAIRARSHNVTRKRREKQVRTMPDPQEPCTNSQGGAPGLLDQELSKLPDKYRAAIVLCDLEGKTRVEAARQLGWPEGSVSGRLARGRAMLAKRLAKHGPPLSVAALATELTRCAASACVPPAPNLATIKAASLFAAGQTAATGVLSVKAAALAEGTIRIMNFTKWAMATVSFCLLTGLGGLGWGGYQLVQDGVSPSSNAPPIQDASSLPNNAAKPAVKQTDNERIAGVWRLVLTHRDSHGVDDDPDFENGERFIVTKDGKWTFSTFDEIRSRTTYEIVESGKIDFVYTDGLQPAIYRFDGDNRLTVCLSTDKVRPTELIHEERGPRFLWRLVRAKPGEEKTTQEETDRASVETYRYKTNYVKASELELALKNALGDGAHKIRSNDLTSWVYVFARESLIAQARKIMMKYDQPRFQGQQPLATHVPIGPVGQRFHSESNLFHISIGFHTYHNVYGRYPRHAIYSADGKTPLLSWRVAILPWIGESALYRQFKLNEPWDSEHNKELIAKMPNVYAPPFAITIKPRETCYQVVTGPQTLFDGANKTRTKDILDGPMNKLMVVEAKDSVIWTKPADLALSEIKDKNLSVGGHLPNGFNALFCDGTVRYLSPTLPATTLRSLVMPKDQKVIDFSKLEASPTP